MTRAVIVVLIGLAVCGVGLWMLSPWAALAGAGAALAAYGATAIDVDEE